MGDIKFNLATPKGIYWGLNKVNKLYLGDALLYPNVEYKYNAVAKYNASGETKLFGGCYEHINAFKIDGVVYDNSANWHTFTTDGEHIVEIAFDENITSFKRLFNECHSLTSFEFVDFDTSNVSDFAFMFCDCINVGNIETFDVSNGEQFRFAFSNCGKLENFPMINMSDKCVNLSQFLDRTNFNNYDFIKDWNVSNVETMFSLFAGTTITVADLSSWNLSKVTDMKGMFNGATNLIELRMNSSLNSNLDVTDMFAGITTNGTFYYNGEYDYSKIIEVLPETWNAIDTSASSEEFDIILHFDESNVSESKPFGIKVNNVEYTATTSPLKLTYADVGVTNADEITSYNIGDSNANHKAYYLTKVEKLPIGKRISNFESMFHYCRKLQEVNIDDWNLSGSYNCNFMFAYCEELTAIKKNGEVVESFGDTFTPISTWGMFGYCDKLVTIPSVNMYNVTNANYMFSNCLSVEYITLTNNWINIETTENMFEDCGKLKRINLNTGNFASNSSWTSAQQMFDGCISLEEDPLNDSYMKTNRLQNVLGMYRNCKSLRYINLFNSSYWSFTDLTLIANCFAGCENLNEIHLSNLSYVSSYITNLYNLFNGCSSLSYVGLYGWTLENVENYDNMFNECWNLYWVDLDSANCETLDVIKNALNNAGLSERTEIQNAPNCGGGSVKTSDRFILQVKPFNTSNIEYYDEYNNGYGRSFNDDCQDEFIWSESYEDFKMNAGFDIYGLNINNWENIISIPYIDTLRTLGVHNNNCEYMNLSMSNLNDLTSISIYANDNLMHLDLSNWQTVNIISSEIYNNENLKTIKMLNCSDEAKQFVQENIIDNNGLNDCIIITEDNNHYITTTSEASESNIKLNYSNYTLYSPVTNIQDFGYSDLNGVEIEQMFEGNHSILSVLNTPSLYGTYNYKRLFNSSTLRYIDLSSFDLNWTDSTNINNIFAYCRYLKWVNLTNVDFTNTNNVSTMFKDCESLKWVFAYNVNDETYYKIQDAISNAQNNGYATDCILFCDQNNN